MSFLFMLQFVLFDYDGTMAPTSERQFDWFKYWWNHDENSEVVKKGDFKRVFPYDNLNSFMVMYNEKLHLSGGVQNVYDFLGLKCDMNDKNHPVWPAYQNFLSENPSRLYPGMKEAVEEIHNTGNLSNNPMRNKRLRIGINTTNTWKSVYKDLKQNDVLKYFDCFVTEEILSFYDGNGNQNSIKKPSKISLALALGLLDSDGNYTIHVGDTLNDLAASQKVIRLNPLHPETLITVGVSWGY